MAELALKVFLVLICVAAALWAVSYDKDEHRR
jgi:hypothetical protein